MAKEKNDPVPVSPATVRSDTVIKEQRGAYLGPKGEPVEMTPSTLVNPNPQPTDQQSGQSGESGKGKD